MTEQAIPSTARRRAFLSPARQRDLAALLILTSAVALFFWPVITGQAWLPRGGGDSVSFIYPMYRFTADSLRSGTIPLWNPYQYAGQPFLADNQNGLFYPINLALFLLWPAFSYSAIQWLVILHVWLAGVFTYICLRHLTPDQPLRWEAATLGGLAWMFSGVFVTHIGNLNLIAVSAWLPLAFLALRRSSLADGWQSRLSWALAGGAALGIGTLAGHGQMTFLLAAFLGTYALYHAVAHRQAWALGALAVLGVVAMGIAAISLIPAFEGVAYTVRGSFSAEQATNYALPVKGLTGLLAPNFYGRGEVVFWGGWSRVEYGYVGVLTLLLAAVTLAKRPTRLMLFFWLGAALFLLLALGRDGILYGLLLDMLPVFPFQVPARFVLLLDFCLAALAAFGLDALLRQPQLSKRFLTISAVGVAAAIGWLVWLTLENAPAVPHHADQMRQALLVFAALGMGGWLLLALRGRGRLGASLFAALALLLLGMDLIGLGRYVEIEWGDPMPGFAIGTPGLAYLQNDPGLHRIDIATGAWQPNMPQIEQLYAVRGVYNPLELSRYAAYIGSVGYRGSPLYNLLGTKYVIGGKKEPPADTNIIVPVFADDPNVTIYLNTLALPRVQVIYNATVVDSAEAAFDAIHSAEFDPQTELILESGQPLNGSDGQFQITVLEYGHNRARFDVTTDQPAYLLLSDMVHPHWRATVNGQETPIHVADYALRAVALEPGQQTVEMWFDPPGWQTGRAITLLVSLLLAGWFGLIWYRKRHRATPLP